MTQSRGKVAKLTGKAVDLKQTGAS